MYNTDNKVNKALKIAMIQHNITNNELSERMQKSKQATSNLLKQDNYTLDTLDSLLNALGYKLKLIFEDTENKNNIEID
jgi:transcriptional regulator with XRE-family HTH domain